MSYNIDLKLLSIKKYKDILKKQNLLPGRKILLQNIDENFNLFINIGINSVFELKNRISNSKKISSLAEELGISADYLNILKREIGSLEQKPVLLTSFPDIEVSQIEKLNNEGIKTSKDYFENQKIRNEEIFCLCDLVRINGMGPVAARAFYNAGYVSVSKVADAETSILLKKITEVNNLKKYFKGNLGMKDMQFCIDFAQLLVSLTGGGLECQEKKKSKD